MPDEASTRLRLNQAIAKTGLCSRRKADELIAAGKVKINGITCRDFNATIDTETDHLDVNGKALSFKQYQYILLNKPRGVLTTVTDDRGRKTVMHVLPRELRHLKPVGRLDMNSEGLLILTNDGEFALKMTHPRHHLPKLYEVIVRGSVPDEALDLLADGVPLEDGVTLPANVELLERTAQQTVIHITLREGKNRQIRRMFGYVGHPVLRLVRLSIGGLQLGQTRVGTWRYLTSQEVSDLYSQSTD
jgi:23S rRNA pseudouridine2605 synthase